MVGLYYSEQKLYKHITDNDGVSFQQIEEFVVAEDLQFYGSLLRTLNEGIIEGEITFSRGRWKGINV